MPTLVEKIQAQEQAVSDQWNKLNDDFNDWYSTHDYSDPAYASKSATLEKKLAQLDAKMAVLQDQEWKASWREDAPGPETEEFLATITQLQIEDAQQTAANNRWVAQTMKDAGVEPWVQDSLDYKTKSSEIMLQYLGGDAYDADGNIVTTPKLAESDFTVINTDTTALVNGEQGLDSNETFEAIWERQMTMKSAAEMDDNQDDFISLSEFKAWLAKLQSGNTTPVPVDAGN